MRELMASLRVLRLRPRAVGAAVGAGVLTAGSALALAGLSAWLITKAWTMPPVLALSLAVTAVRALGITRGLMRYCERLATHAVALAGLTEARVALYSRLADAEPAAAGRLSSEELLARTGTDVDELGELVVRSLIPGVVAATIATAATTWLILVNTSAGLVLGACLLLAGLVAPWLTARATAARTRAEARAAQRFGGAASALLDHHAELAVAGRLGVVRALAAAAEEHRRAAVDRSVRIGALADATVPLAIGIAALAALLCALPAAASGADATTIGVLILLPLSAFEVIGPLPDAARQAVRSTQAARRLAPLLVAPPVPMGDRSVAQRPVLRLGGLTVAPGDRVLITGRSGVGKTTLLRALAGLDSRGGEVLVDDRPAAQYADLTGAIGYFGEDAHIFATTLAENCRVSQGAATDAEIASALEAVGLGEWLSGLPQGIDTVLDDGAASLSGGQRRRLLLARAVLSPVQTVLLDEPVENVDRRDAAALLDRILAEDGLFPGRSLVVAGHAQSRGVRQISLDAAAPFAPAPAPATTTDPAATAWSSAVIGGSPSAVVTGVPRSEAGSPRT